VVLKDRWSNIIVLKVHAPTEDESENSNDSFCEELEQVFDCFSKYYMKILLGYFNENWKERIFSTEEGRGG
jgi:hypothetical protein